jgi:hypothetical protein
MLALTIVPFLVLVLGALVYGLSGNPKVSEMGRISFFCGLFWLVQMFAGHVVRLP